MKLPNYFLCNIDLLMVTRWCLFKWPQIESLLKAQYNHLAMHTRNLNIAKNNKRCLTHGLHCSVDRSTNKITTYRKASLLEFMFLLDAELILSLSSMRVTARLYILISIRYLDHMTYKILIKLSHILILISGSVIF